MTKILNRFEVNKALSSIIAEAQKEIILISPYIKLNDDLKRALYRHHNKNDFQLIIVYGKNEENKRQSLSDSDLDFFKQFSNVEVRYHWRLYAKLYANDFATLITSMNLHDYSMKENIEIGVYLEMNLLRDIGSSILSNVSHSLEDQARDFAEYIINKSEIHFEKHITVKKSFFGLIKDYGSSSVSIDKRKLGFCIRSGKPIPFNPDKPFAEEAFVNWSKYKNPLYKEKFCHGCGREFSTSMKNPLCIDCFHQ